MARQPKTYAAEIGNHVYYGESMAEAKQKRAAAIEEVFSGTWEPTVLPYRDLLLVMYRYTGGYVYQIIHPAEGMKREVVACCYSCDQSRDTVWADACLHLAQRAWRPEDGDTVPDFLPEKFHADHRSWCRFQLRHAHFKSQGHSPEVCHAMACDSRYETPALEELAAQAA